MSVLQDIRLAVRLLGRTPVSTAISLLSVALSVGATAVVFAAIKSVLIDPLPYARSEELVLLRSEYPRMQEQSQGDWVVWNDIRELPVRTQTLESIGVYGNAMFDLAGDGRTTPEALYGLRMSANLFRVLGVSPMIGRNVLPEEGVPGHPDVMILSHGLWVRRFNSDRSVIGRAVVVNGRACTVVGVMPPEFNFPMRRGAVRTPSPYVEFWAAPLETPSNPIAGLGAVGRLRPGVSVQQARQDLASISRALEREFPATNRDRVLTANSLRSRTVGSASSGLLLLMAATVLFMLIGCANVANLLLARGFAREGEMAVRLALGAGKARIVRQLLTESCVLAVLGGVCGFLLTVWAWTFLPAIAPVSIPRLAAARSDSSVFVFALALAVLNGLLFGIVPALRMPRWSGLGARGAATGRHDRVRFSLVATEVALAVLLVVVGGQVLSSFVQLVRTDPGFQLDRVLASVVLPAHERYPNQKERGLFYRRMLDSVRGIPGVQSAGTVDALPFSGENHGGSVSAGSQRLTAEIDVAGGDYLQTMGIRLLEGRWFREEEMIASNDSAIVNTLIAEALWPGDSAIGKRVCVHCTPEDPDNWKQVIGVVSNASHRALDEAQMGNVYLAAGAMESAAFLVVRTDRPTGEIGKAIRGAIAALDPNQPVFLSASMRELISDSVADRRFMMVLLAITGSLALMMSAAGVYGVIAYTTSRRTQEIGIRMALGATPSNVVRLVFTQGFRAVALGLAVGLVAAWITKLLLRTAVLGLESSNPASILVAAMLVTATALTACWIPARRAIQIDPMSALRQD
jgi:putative ABC transport system permease protein